MSEIDWSKQHCGVHQAPVAVLLGLMPDLAPVVASFPDDALRFTWDVKVHMLMPRQFPCIPGWHQDFVPRVDGIQRFELIRPELPMYCWVSGAPLTQFQHGYLEPRKWHRFTQLDSHRGTPAAEFTWRAFIRAVDQRIQAPKTEDHLRRHCQVYVDAGSFQW